MVIVPVYKTKEAESILKKANEIYDLLKKAGIRAHLDDRDNYTPGWKYNHWELKGVPIRIELGPKDLAKNEVRVIKRNNFAKF